MSLNVSHCSDESVGAFRCTECYVKRRYEYGDSSAVRDQASMCIVTSLQTKPECECLKKEFKNRASV